MFAGPHKKGQIAFRDHLVFYNLKVGTIPAYLGIDMEYVY